MVFSARQEVHSFIVCFPERGVEGLLLTMISQFFSSHWEQTGGVYQVPLTLPALDCYDLVIQNPSKLPQLMPASFGIRFPQSPFPCQAGKLEHYYEMAASCCLPSLHFHPEVNAGEEQHSVIPVSPFMIPTPTLMHEGSCLSWSLQVGQSQCQFNRVAIIYKHYSRCTHCCL